MGFRTKLDYSSNRQINQREKTNTILSGGTTFGIPFSGLTVGPDLTTSAITQTYGSVISTFSGNSTTTIYNWFDPRMELAVNTLSAITPTNSATTQETGYIYTGNSYTIIDGNKVNLDYTGTYFTVIANYIIDLGGGAYSGTVQHDELLFLSASSLDYNDRLIWVDNPEITRTNKLIISTGATIDYVWTCIDSEGMGAWRAVSGGTSSTGNTLAQVLINGNSTGNNWIDVDITSAENGIRSNDISNKDKIIEFNPDGIDLSVYSNLYDNSTIISLTNELIRLIGVSDSGVFPTNEAYIDIYNNGNIAMEGTGDLNINLETVTISGQVGLFTGAEYSHDFSANYNNRSLVDKEYVDKTITGFTGVWSAGTGTNSAVLSGSDSIATGNYAVSEGHNTTASGVGSHAQGWKTIASSWYSSASGSYTTASGYGAHAEGHDTTASGYQSHAEGHNTTANGDYSHAEGNGTIASGIASHAQGVSATASGYISHAEGVFTLASNYTSHAEGTYTTASGYGAHSEGGNSTASGYYSHAEGQYTISNGSNSHSEGQNTKAIGSNSHAEGYYTTASGSTSHAEGDSTTALNYGSHSEGYFTTAYGRYSHAEGVISIAVGHGSHAEGGYHNGFTIVSGSTSNGNGSHAEGNGTTANGVASHAEGNITVSIGSYSHSEGSYTTSSGYASHSEGSNTIASGNTSHAEGGYTTASGNYSHSEGLLTISMGDYGSHAEGYYTLANGYSSHAEGASTTASGGESHAEGQNTTALGFTSHSEGYYTTASGNYSHSEGYNAAASGSTSHAEGYFTIASGNNSHAEGYFTIASGYTSHAEGYSTTSGGQNSHAEGNHTTASGDYSHASGKYTIASGLCSYTSGYVTTASGDYSFVHGKNSQATNNHTIVFGQNISGTSANTVYVPDLIIDGLTSTDPIATDSNGKIVAGTSDARLKQNINQLNNSLDIIKNLRGVSFEYTLESEMGDGVRYGFIAQEVQKFIPEIVRNRAKGDSMLSLNYNEIVPVLVEAVKELSTGTTNNTYLETQTILAEDNNIDLNYNGTHESALDGGITIKHGIDADNDSYLKINSNGDFVSNVNIIPSGIVIPRYTPTSSLDTYGIEGNFTRDDDYLYIKTNNTWKRTKLETF